MPVRQKEAPDASTDMRVGTDLYQRIYAVTRQIPPGEVASYGQVALVAGANSARIVGNAMSNLPNGSSVPWHRVLNSQGKISDRGEGGSDKEQQRRLHKEGVFFDGKGRVDFTEVAWTGPPWDWLEENGYDIDLLALKSQSIRRRGSWVRWRL